MVNPMDLRVGMKVRILEDYLEGADVFKGEVQEIFEVYICKDGEGVKIGTEEDKESYDNLGPWVFSENLNNNFESNFNQMEVVVDE